MLHKEVISTEDEVYIIRKLLEQIHNYLKYLECPYYNVNISERDLLLILVQPSERRYHLIEWMISRLEPDIDFYMPNDYGQGEFTIESHITEDYINAISYLKNLGLCYSRLLVPDIVHAKVAPLVQLKFFVRLLSGIRLKSWNRKPIIKKNIITNKLNNHCVSENTSQNELGYISSKLDINTLNEDLINFIIQKIRKNHVAKTILELLENKLKRQEILNFKENLCISLKKRLENKRHSKSKENIEFQNSLNFSKTSFISGMTQLIIEEILPQISREEKSTLCISNSSDTNHSPIIKNNIIDSKSLSKCSGDLSETSNADLIKKYSCLNENSESLLKEVSKLYSTTIKLTKQLPCNGDDCFSRIT